MNSQSRVTEGSPVSIRALLLDFGAVISVSVFERHRETEQILGLRPGTLAWMGPIAPQSDPLWQAMQREEITEREYWARRARELGELVGEPDWDVTTMLTRVRQVDPDAVVRPEMTALINDARPKGVLVGILSNEMELFYGKRFLERMQILRSIDVIVDATHTRILKPDPRSYAMAVEALGVKPEETLFVDDQFRNVAGAFQAGLQTHHFDLRDVSGNTAALRARLGLNGSLCSSTSEPS